MEQTNIFTNDNEMKNSTLKLKSNPTERSGELYSTFLTSLINLRNALKNSYDYCNLQNDRYLEYKEFCDTDDPLFLRVAALSVASEDYNFDDIEIIQKGIKLSQIIPSYRADDLWGDIEASLKEVVEFFSKGEFFDICNPSEHDTIINKLCQEKMKKLKLCIGNLNFLLIIFTDSPNIKTGEVYIFVKDYVSNIESEKSVLEEALLLSQSCDNIFEEFKPKIEFILKYPELAESIREKINDDSLYINLIDLSSVAELSELKELNEGKISIDTLLFRLKERYEEEEE